MAKNAEIKDKVLQQKREVGARLEKVQEGVAGIWGCFARAEGVSVGGRGRSRGQHMGLGSCLSKFGKWKNQYQKSWTEQKQYFASLENHGGGVVTLIKKEMDKFRGQISRLGLSGIFLGYYLFDSAYCIHIFFVNHMRNYKDILILNRSNICIFLISKYLNH